MTDELRKHLADLEAQGSINRLYDEAEALRTKLIGAIQTLSKWDNNLRFANYRAGIENVTECLEELKIVLDRVRELEDKRAAQYPRTNFVAS